MIHDPCFAFVEWKNSSSLTALSLVSRCVAENAGGRVETRCNLVIKPLTKPPGAEDLIQPEVVERAHAPPPKPPSEVRSSVFCLSRGSMRVQIFFTINAAAEPRLSLCGLINTWSTCLCAMKRQAFWSLDVRLVLSGLFRNDQTFSVWFVVSGVFLTPVCFRDYETSKCDCFA